MGSWTDGTGSKAKYKLQSKCGRINARSKTVVFKSHTAAHGKDVLTELLQSFIAKPNFTQCLKPAVQQAFRDFKDALAKKQ